jgi:uncharacterized membrane protein
MYVAQKFFKKYIVLLPLIYLFITVFFAREKVQYVYVASAVLILLVVFTQYRQKIKPELFLAQWMLVLASIGLVASVILSIEKVELLAEPDRVASCSISPIVACSPVIKSWQSAVFGFPNSFIGIFGFTAVLTAAITILAGATKLSRVWWRTLLAGIAFGAIFSSWLIYQGVLNIGKLCLYCMLVWLISFALLWLVSAHTTQNKYVDFGNTLNKLLSYKYELITITFTVILLLLFYRWSDYWLGLF